MFGLFDDLTLLGKRAGAFFTGKGASITAVALASSQVPAAQLPIVGLTVGLPITAAMNTMVHHYREMRILNKFAPEIAQEIGKSVDEVTPDDLRSLAFGDDTTKGNVFFREALEHNDKSRWISIGANIVAGITTIGIIAAQGGAIATAMTGAAASIGIPAVLASFGLSLATASIMLFSDRVANVAATRIFDNNHRTAYDKLETIERQHNRGADISASQIMGLIADVNPYVQQDIQDQYGAKFTDLREDARNAVVARYDSSYQLHASAAAMNNGTMPLTAIGFMADATVQPEQTRKAASTNVATNDTRTDFVARYAPQREQTTATSHVERLSRDTPSSPDVPTLH